jgi:hypothetical protein
MEQNNLIKEPVKQVKTKEGDNKWRT